MKTSVLTFKMLLAFLLLFTSMACEQDELQEPVGKFLSVEDFNLTLLESPTEDQTILGIINAQTDNTTGVTFELLSQSPEGAFAVSQSTGELTILDLQSFEVIADATTPGTVTGVVRVRSGQVLEKTINVAINLGAVTEEEVTDSEETLQ